MNDSNDDTKKPLRRTIRGGRAFFFSDPAIDKVLNMVVTLGSEVWALRERLAAVEAVQVKRGQLGGDEVDAYEFTPEQEARLASDRKEFIDNLFRILQEQVELAAAKTAGAADAADGVGDAPGAKKVLFGARGAKAAKAAPARAVRKPAARAAARARPAARTRSPKRSATRR
jgi:hypothetical protein